MHLRLAICREILSDYGLSRRDAPTTL